MLSSKPVTDVNILPTGRQESLLVADHTNVDWLLRSRLGSHLFLIAGSAAVPAAALHALTRGGEAPVSGVGHLVIMAVGSSIAAFACIALAIAGVRGRDGRSLISGGAFGAMTLLLVIHGLATPGVFIGPNGIIALAIAAHLLFTHFVRPSPIRRGWDYGLIGGAKLWMPRFNPFAFFATFAVGALAAGLHVHLARYRGRILCGGRPH